MNRKICTPTARFTICITIGFLLFVSIVLPFVSTWTTSLIGISESPDTSIFPSVEALRDIMNLYGANGRKIYIIMRWTFDVIWPVVYTLFFITVSSYFLSQKGYTKKLLMIPLLAVFFDVVENTLMTVHMALYPSEMTVLLSITPYVILSKWIFVFGSFVVVFGLLVQYLYDKKKTLN